MRALALACLLGAAAPSAGACALELILAVDVSGSIDGDEWRLQAEGMAAAFDDPGVIEAMSALEGGALVTYTQWSGTSRQRQVTGWHTIEDAESARVFSTAIRRAGRAWRNFSTAIGDALAHARAVGATAPERCRRRVIDISGDGVSNEGSHPLSMSRLLASEGYQINALVIRGANPDPLVHFRELVIAGPGAFIEIAEGFEDYPRAIRRKLLREIRQDMLISVAPRAEVPPATIAD